MRHPCRPALPSKRFGLALAASAFLAFAVTPSAASAAAAAGPRVITPRTGAVVLGDSARLVLRVPSPGRSLRVRVGRRIVTNAFARASDGLRVARLGVADGLRYGPNTVYVQAGDRRHRRFTEVSFVLARPVSGLLRSVSARPAVGSPGHARLLAPAASKAVRIRVRVNGDRPVAVRGGARVLDADEGLRHGANVLSVMALDASQGRFERRRLPLLMPRGTPIPASGPSVRTSVGSVVRADASRSLATRDDARLSYRWRILRAPAGSRARLLTTSSVRPSLRPDRPGRYLLRVRVAERRGSRPVAVTGQAGAAPTAATSVDTVAITVGANVPPVGLPFEAIATQGTAVGVSVPGLGPSTSFLASDPSQALQLVVLDRTNSGGPPTTQAFTNDLAGAMNLQTTVKGLTANSLVVITKPRSTVTNAIAGNAAQAAATINATLGTIGVPKLPVSVLTGNQACGGTGQCSAFSAVGVPGLSSGGDVNPGLGTTGGDLTGFLQVDNAKRLAYVNRERVTFDTTTTDTPSASTQATVSVGDATYPSSALPPGTPGFFVLVMDSGSLANRDSGGTTYTESAADLAAMDSKLKQWAADPSALVFVQSIGSVGRDRAASTQAWDAIAADLEQLGGSGLYFEAVNSSTSNQYAQVGPGGGPGGYPSDFTQVASTDRTSSGRLTGLLARNGSSQFFPAEAREPAQPLAGTLSGLISTPSTPWPMRDTVGHLAAMRCVAANLSTPLTYPIESNYTTVQNWGSKAADLNGPGLSYSSLINAGCTGFTAQDLTDVIGQLEKEWQHLGDLFTLFEINMKTLYSAETQSSAIYSIASTINTDVQQGNKPSNNSTLINGLEMASDIGWILSALPGFGPVEGLLNVAAGGLGLAADGLANDSNGASTLTDITATADTFASQLNTAAVKTEMGFDQAYSIFATDWGKLQIAAANADGGSEAAWSWVWTTSPSDSFSLMSTQLKVAAARSAARALFPLKYGLYRVQGANPNGVDGYQCAATSGQGFNVQLKLWKPFAKTPQYGGWPVRNSAGTLEQWVYAGPDDGFLEASQYGPPTVQATYPGKTVLQTLVVQDNDDFNPGLQLFKPMAFAVEAFTNGTSPDGSTTIKLVKQVRFHPSPYIDSPYGCQLSTP